MSLLQYTTPLTGSENPISESSSWSNGGTDGAGNWADVSKDGSGHAIGHQTGVTGSDSTACLKSSVWPDTTPDYETSATVFVSSVPATTCAPEVELRGRTKIDASPNNRGYENAMGFGSGTGPYNILVKWRGGLGQFDVMVDQTHGWLSAADGDVHKMRCVGGAISAYLRGTLIGRAFDNAFTDGQPGMGFNLENGGGSCAGANTGYGYRAGWTTTEIADAATVAAANGGFLDVAGGNYGTAAAAGADGDSSASTTLTVLERAIAPGDCVIVVTAYGNASAGHVRKVDDGSSGQNQYEKVATLLDASNGEAFELWICSRAVVAVSGNPIVTATLDTAYAFRGITAYHTRRRVVLGPVESLLNTTGVTAGIKCERKGVAVQIAVDAGAQKITNYTANNGWTHRGEAIGTILMAFGDREVSGANALTSSWSMGAGDSTANFVIMLYDDPMVPGYTNFPKSPVANNARGLRP